MTHSAPPPDDPPDGGGAASNHWGRWGAADERGAANFATPERLAQAARLVRSGKVYSLALPLQASGVPINPQRSAPVHVMTRHAGDHGAGHQLHGAMCAADDHLAMPTQTGTHIDALSHVWYGDSLYNGHPVSHVGSQGASRLGIDKLGHLAGRGVLLDLPGFLGVPRLGAAQAITPAELDACATAQGTPVGEGDIVLVRTGWLGGYDDANAAEFWRTNPGLGVAAAEWIGMKHVAAVGADNFAVEVHPSEAGPIGPVHMRLIRDFGCHLMELMVLDDLARDGVHEFLFIAAPLPITGGTGSPINPLALC